MDNPAQVLGDFAFRAPGDAPVAGVVETLEAPDAIDADGDGREKRVSCAPNALGTGPRRWLFDSPLSRRAEGNPGMASRRDWDAEEKR